MEWIAALVVIGLLAASGRCWAQAAGRLRAEGRLLAHEPRREAPWGLVDLALAVMLLGLLEYAAVVLLVGEAAPHWGRPFEDLSLAERATLVWAGAAATLTAVALSAALVAWRTTAGWRDLGLAPAKTASDLKLGAAAFLMLAPIVYAIQWLLVQRYESKHPLIELLREDPSPSFFAVSFFAAIIVAPVAEEYLFRVLLQGWLEKAAARRGPLRSLIVGGFLPSPLPAAALAGAADADGSWGKPRGADGPTADHPLAGEKDHPEPPRPAAASRQDDNPYHAPCEETPAASAPAPCGAERPHAWPILVSSGVFALLHLKHGPDCIPLFVLALGLGYLYQRTHRILPSMVVHLLLNSCSLAALLLEVFNSPG